MTVDQLTESLKASGSVTIDGIEMELSLENALALADTLERVRSAEEEILALVGAGHDWYVATASRVFHFSVGGEKSSSSHHVTLASWPRSAVTSLRITTHYTSRIRGAGAATVSLRTAELTCDGIPLTLQGEHPDNDPTPEQVLRFARALGGPPDS